jgi:hypothetical protein
MHNIINLDTIPSVIELNKLMSEKKITFEQFRETLNKFERITYRYDENGNQVDIVHHEGKSPIGK